MANKRSTRQLEVRKVQLGRKCFLVAAVDEEETVITAGAFNSQDEADTAANMLFSFMFRFGFIDAEEREMPNLKLNDMCEKCFQTSEGK